MRTFYCDCSLFHFFFYSSSFFFKKKKERCNVTPFAVHYEKIRIHLRETVTNRAKIHS